LLSKDWFWIQTFDDHCMPLYHTFPASCWAIPSYDTESRLNLRRVTHAQMSPITQSRVSQKPVVKTQIKRNLSAT